MGGDDNDRAWFQRPRPVGNSAFSLCRLLSKAFVLREERVMKGRGRSVLSFVFACALIGALAPAASADHGATQRAELRPGWKFTLVNTPAHRSDRGLRQRRRPGFDDSTWRSVDLPHDWSIELDPTTDRNSARHRVPQGGLGWYRKTSRCPPPCRQADLGRLRRRLHGLRTSISTACCSATTRTATRATTLASTSWCTPTADANVPRRARSEKRAAAGGIRAAASSATCTWS